MSDNPSGQSTPAPQARIEAVTQARIETAYTRSGYHLPPFTCYYGGPANLIGLWQLVHESTRPYALIAPPRSVLSELDQSEASRLHNIAIGTIPVTFELGNAKVDSFVFVLPFPYPPLIGTETLFALIRESLFAANSTAPRS